MVKSIAYLVSMRSDFEKHGIEALLEDWSRKVVALPNKAAAAVDNHARGGKWFLFGLEREILHAPELRISAIKSVLARRVRVDRVSQFLHICQLKGSDAKLILMRRLQARQH